MKKKKEIKVAELFAGVGGFRLGLEASNSRKSIKYKVVWFNQWEPSTKEQHAWKVYIRKFHQNGKIKHNNTNTDISKINVLDIPDFDLLVGGFPCQDYSVARTLKQADGIVGKKGVLWWQIERIIRDKANIKKAPSYLILENVDRLLKSPAKQRGRDFAIMLASLNKLGYIVEWRVINAAEYGMPQRRRRVFILGYKNDTMISKKIRALEHPTYWILDEGVIAKSFPVIQSKINKPIHDEFLTVDDNILKVSDNFKGDNNKTPFGNTGIMIDYKVFSLKTTAPEHFARKGAVLKSILLDEKDVGEEYFIKKRDIEKWKCHKGAKSEPRRSSSGHEYHYSEGAMFFPDSIDKPSRTIVTGEGGNSPSRFKHVVRTPSGRLRRLTPVELERLNMFPDNHTKHEGVTDTKRAFFMGNALVVDIVKRLGVALINKLVE